MRGGQALGTMTVLVMGVATLSASAFADEPSPTLGGPGESCRARSDCEAGLKCIQEVCVSYPRASYPGSHTPHEWQSCQSTAECSDGLHCVDNHCIDVARHARLAAPPFAIAGMHTFLGLVTLTGPAYGGVISSPSRWDTSAEGSFILAVRVGVLIDGLHELAVEVSPFTYAYYTPLPGPAFQLNATYGYLVPIYAGSAVAVYWPLRVGAGFFAGNVGGHVYAQTRADLLGFSARFDQFVVDFYAPSFRYAITNAEGTTANVLSWEFGVGGSYVF